MKGGGEGLEGKRRKEGEGRERKGRDKKEKKREKGNLKTKSPNNGDCKECTLKYFIIYIDCI